MKIVYIVEDFAENGGVERIVSLKANELSTKYGHDVTIVSVYKDERPMLYSLDKSIGFVRLDVPSPRKATDALRHSQVEWRRSHVLQADSTRR